MLVQTCLFFQAPRAININRWIWRSIKCTYQASTWCKTLWGIQWWVTLKELNLEREINLSELFSSFWSTYYTQQLLSRKKTWVQGKDKGDQQGLPECLCGALAQWTSKSQPSGKVPATDNAQALAISPSPMMPTASLCVKIIHTSLSWFYCISDNSLITQ